MQNRTPLPLIKKQTLAEQVSEVVRGQILSGELAPGQALPTEPELAAQFGVSRAVARDATRMLAAQGLVVAQHGRGVFVTDTPVEAFGEALLLGLRRVGATAWDVEQFEQVIFPGVCALAAQEASPEEIAALRQLLAEQAAEAEAIFAREIEGGELTPAGRQQYRALYLGLLQAIFELTHNRLLLLLTKPLLSLRNLRSWEGEPDTLETWKNDQAIKEMIVEAVASRNPEQARSIVSDLMKLLPERAVEAMRRTPVGEITRIPPAKRSD